MIKAGKVAIIAAASIGVLANAAPAVAQQNIPYTYNSDDHDSKARFEATGEHIYAYEYNGTNYVDYTFVSNASRWYIPGDDNKTRKDLNLSIAEGKSVTIKVCQNHENFPDDCSGTKYGVS